MDAAGQIARIRSVAAHAQTAFGDAPFLRRLSRAAPDLVPIDAPVAARMASELERSFRWADDLLCVRRAVIGAQFVNQSVGRGAAAIDDAAAAAVALVHRPKRPGWAHHAAPLFTVRGAAEPTVVDPLLGGTMPLSAWAAQLGRSPHDVRIRSAFARLDLGMLPGGHLWHAGEDLVRSIDPDATPGAFSRAVRRLAG